MTDERASDPVPLLAALRRGDGVVFRHHATPPRDRRALFARVQRAARVRGLVLFLADRPAVARAWHADGCHSRTPYRSHGLRSVAVHDARELALAQRMGADLVFISPVFATRSHIGARALGPVRAGLIAGRARGIAVALGGMDPARARRTAALGFQGWAGIDAFTTDES